MKTKQIAAILAVIVLMGSALHAQDPPAGARVTTEGWFSPIERSESPPPLPEKVDNAYIIKIHTVIDETTYRIIKHKLLICKNRAQLVIFDLDTPGGQVSAMSKIVKLILQDLGEIYTVAYVNPSAISAGATIALACDEIVMSRSANIGAAMPIMIGPQGIVELPAKVRGKFESYDKSKIRNLAKRNGYDPLLCQAMITLNIEVWLMKNSRTGQLKFVNSDQWKKKPKADTAPWQYVRTIDDKDSVLTMTTDEAVELGFAKHVFAKMTDLAEHYHTSEAPEVLMDDFAQKLVRFLTSPAVVSLLTMAGIFFIYAEFKAPGFGLAGGLAIACFAVLFGSKFLIGLANWWEIALFAVGLVLIGLEIMVIPGFGVAGIAGILCCIFAMLAMVVPNAPGSFPIPKTDLDWNMFLDGIVATSIGFILSIALCAVAAKYLPKLPLVNRLILASAESAHDAPATDQAPIMHVHVGDVGTVQSVCRPVGRVLFGDDLLDAVSEGEIIQAGEKVRVVRRDSNRVIVEITERDV